MRLCGPRNNVSMQRALSQYRMARQMAWLPLQQFDVVCVTSDMRSNIRQSWNLAILAMTWKDTDTGKDCMYASGETMKPQNKWHDMEWWRLTQSAHCSGWEVGGCIHVNYLGDSLTICIISSQDMTFKSPTYVWKWRVMDSSLVHWRSNMVQNPSIFLPTGNRFDTKSMLHSRATYEEARGDTVIELVFILVAVCLALTSSLWAGLQHSVKN